jgi:hypothetical protein
MAADIGWIKPADKIVAWGRPNVMVEREIETVANMYAGRLVSVGSTANEVVVGAPATKQILGWLGYEDTAVRYRPTNVDTIYTVNDRAMIMSGGQFGIVGSLTPNVAVEQGDYLCPWTSGELIPVELTPFGWGIKIPYSSTGSSHALTDTGIDIPAKMLINDAICRVVVADASGTIDVGFENSVESGDLDGLLHGLALAAVGPVQPELCGAGASTLGVLLGTAITATALSPAYPVIRKSYLTNGTIKSIVYDCSAHTQSGYILIALSGVGFGLPVARAVEAVASSTSSQDIMVESLI